MSPDDLSIELGPLLGSGAPPQWAYRITHHSSMVAQMSGPRLLVLESLKRFIELFIEESAPPLAAGHDVP